MTKMDIALGSDFAGRAGSVLSRLQHLYPTLIDLSMTRIERLLAALGNPHHRLPPVIHVAGTNGKGSTCAHLRAIAEASGLRVHVMTSPHLVSVTERFRVAGRLVSEDALVETLEEIARVNDGAEITIFEVLTAAGFLLFSRTQADLAIIEVGLGGRGDATNVLPPPAACVIAPISLDHQAFLGDTLGAIAAEKAGILKPGTPYVTAVQPPEAAAVIATTAARVGAPVWEWSITPASHGMTYRDAEGTLSLPRPGLPGAHQSFNAGLAVAALRAAHMPIPPSGWEGLGRTVWPARLQRLDGRLAAQLPDGWELWLDGGHNPGAGEALATALDALPPRPLHLIVGMKQTKDVAGFLTPLLARAESVWAVQEPEQHLALSVDAIVAASGGRAHPGPLLQDVLAALSRRDVPGRALICGSLYLAGVALKQDGWIPA